MTNCNDHLIELYGHKHTLFPQLCLPIKCLSDKLFCLPRICFDESTLAIDDLSYCQEKEIVLL